MPNYGDVAVGLPKNWDRNAFADQEIQHGTVGHTNGVADVALKDSPDQEHQFYWCDIKNMTDMNRHIQRGYVLVHKDTWVKNVPQWDWDASGNLINGYGDGALRLMARPANLFLSDERRRSQTLERASADQSDPDLDDTPEGMVATDDAGREIERKRGGRRPKA